MINQNKFGKFLDKYGSIAIFSVMIIVFCVTAKGFLTPMNGINILVQTAPTLIMALGCTFVNMAGESDLSLGGIVGLSASLFCGFISKGHSVWLAGLVSIGAGALFGALNGFLVSYVGLSSFITTISVMFLTQGLEYAYSGGSSLWVRDNPVTKIVTASVGPIPIIVIATVLVFILVYLALHRTRAGLHIQAVGRSQDAAKFADIHVKGIQFLMFVLAGVFYALGGVINALRSNGAIIYSGQRLLLPVLAVTYIAKTILGTKRPNVPGILVGAVVMTCISTAFTLMALDFYYTFIAQGIVLIIAAILSVSNRRIILQEDLR